MLKLSSAKDLVGLGVFLCHSKAFKFWYWTSSSDVVDLEWFVCYVIYESFRDSLNFGESIITLLFKFIDVC